MSQPTIQTHLKDKHTYWTFDAEESKEVIAWLDSHIKDNKLTFYASWINWTMSLICKLGKGVADEWSKYEDMEDQQRLLETLREKPATPKGFCLVLEYYYSKAWRSDRPKTGGLIKQPERENVLEVTHGEEELQKHVWTRKERGTLRPRDIERARKHNERKQREAEEQKALGDRTEAEQAVGGVEE